MGEATDGALGGRMIGTLPEQNRLLEIGPILGVTRLVPCTSNCSGLSSNKLAFAVRVPLCTSLRRNEILTRNCETGPDYCYLAMRWPSLKHSGLDQPSQNADCQYSIHPDLRSHKRGQSPGHGHCGHRSLSCHRSSSSTSRTSTCSRHLAADERWLDRMEKCMVAAR
jgi:hypothetical protein